jgi:hypothetical protein
VRCFACAAAAAPASSTNEMLPAAVIEKDELDHLGPACPTFALLQGPATRAGTRAGRRAFRSPAVPRSGAAPAFPARDGQLQQRLRLLLLPIEARPCSRKCRAHSQPSLAAPAARAARWRTLVALATRPLGTSCAGQRRQESRLQAASRFRRRRRGKAGNQMPCAHSQPSLAAPAARAARALSRVPTCRRCS